MAGCSGDGETHLCFGTAAFCADGFARNDPPRADAGSDREVTPGDSVQLDGSSSFDGDGSISSYSWTQEAGPTVALSGAAQAVADFIAPDVDAETVLDFRLVVTDNDDASDTDRVRITVLPAGAAAMRAGVALLKAAYRPDADVETSCARCWSYLGLWLGARVRAAKSGADGEIDVLLDEIRVIETLSAARAPVDQLSGAARTLFELGQCEVASFTRTRDPASAELALATTSTCTTLPPVPPEEAAWQQALAAGYPHQPWNRAGAALSAAAARTLLRPSATADPETVAAATLLLSFQRGQ